MFLALAMIMLVVFGTVRVGIRLTIMIATILAIGQMFTFSRIGFLVLFVGLLAALWFERRAWLGVVIASRWCA